MRDHDRPDCAITIAGIRTWTSWTCGKAGCRCHRGAKHGPDAFVTFRQPDGRPGAFDVPEGREREVQAALRAWRQFQTLARRRERPGLEEGALSIGDGL
jgi:hypothetical protein